MKPLGSTHFFSRTALIATALFLAGTLPSPGQNIVLKDGRIITAKAVRRLGGTIMATVTIGGANPEQTGEIGYPLEQIDKVDFPEPPQLKASEDAIVQGKAAQALTQLEPVVTYYSPLREVPGSWWGDLALLKAQALRSTAKEREADQLVDEIGRTAKNPELAQAARAQLAFSLARRGQYAQALQISEEAAKTATRADTLATAALARGLSLLAQKQWANALRSLLQVPVLFPEEKTLLPAATLATARAYAGIEDFAHAKATLQELTTNFPGSTEASLVPAEMQLVERREKALAPQ